MAQWDPLVLIDSLALFVSLFPAMASGFAADLADVAHAKPSEVDLGALPASTCNGLECQYAIIKYGIDFISLNVRLTCVMLSSYCFTT